MKEKHQRRSERYLILEAERTENPTSKKENQILAGIETTLAPTFADSSDCLCYTQSLEENGCCWKISLTSLPIEHVADYILRFTCKISDERQC